MEVKAKTSAKNLYLLESGWYIILIKSKNKYINTSRPMKRVDIYTL